MTLANSSIEAAAGDDSLSISVLSGSTIFGSGADTINLAKVFHLRFTNQGNDLITASGDATTTTLPAVKALIPSISGDVTGGRILGNSGQTASPLMELSIPL